MAPDQLQGLQLFCLIVTHLFSPWTLGPSNPWALKVLSLSCWFSAENLLQTTGKNNIIRGWNSYENAPFTFSEVVCLPAFFHIRFLCSCLRGGLEPNAGTCHGQYHVGHHHDSVGGHGGIVHKSIGSVYAVNSAGCVLEGLVIGFYLIGSLGFRNSVLVLSGMTILAGALIGFVYLRTKVRFAFIGVFVGFLSSLSWPCRRIISRANMQPSNPEAISSFIRNPNRRQRRFLSGLIRTGFCIWMAFRKWARVVFP